LRLEPTIQRIIEVAPQRSLIDSELEGEQTRRREIGPYETSPQSRRGRS
jgi:hypothetical protein